MDNGTDILYDYDDIEVEVESGETEPTQTEKVMPETPTKPLSEDESKSIDRALELLPDSTDELEKMTPEEVSKLAKSFLNTAKAQPVASEPEPEPEPEPVVDINSKQVTKEEKVELTAASIVGQGELLTTINSLGEQTTYMAEKVKLGDKQAVAYWSRGSNFELECYCLGLMRNRHIMQTARCRVPTTSNNIKQVCATAVHHSALLGKKLTPSDRHSILLTAHGLDDKGNDIEPIYYDMEKGEIMLYSELPLEKQGRCFRRFCNSVDGIAHVPYIPEEQINIGLVKKHFEMARQDMVAHYNALLVQEKTTSYPIRFNGSVMKWACDDPFLYVDILTLAAVPLLVRKPETTFFILGEKGNGKSSFRHLLQCTYGTRNVSGVQVSQMGSWDYAATLIGKSLNFPDEESTNIETMDKAVFKSMSTHETITIRQKGSSTPFEILCDFPSVIPLNELPNWKNLDGGIARRITVLPFNANLMEEAKQGGIGYEERTYTPNFISRFLGEIMGIASFYTQTGRPILWSPATMSASNNWTQEASNLELFIQDFQRVFKGFSSLKTLYSCYQCWCRGGLGAVDTGIEYQYETMKRLKEVLCVFGGWDAKRTIRVSGRDTPVRCVCHHDTEVIPQEWLLWDGTLLDVGAIGGASWANGRDNVITAAEALEHGWDPVTLRLMSQGLNRRDMELQDDFGTVVRNARNAELEKGQASR